MNYRVVYTVLIWIRWTPEQNFSKFGGQFLKAPQFCEKTAGEKVKDFSLDSISFLFQNWSTCWKVMITFFWPFCPKFWSFPLKSHHLQMIQEKFQIQLISFESLPKYLILINFSLLEMLTAIKRSEFTIITYFNTCKSYFRHLKTVNTLKKGKFFLQNRNTISSRSHCGCKW